MRKSIIITIAIVLVLSVASIFVVIFIGKGQYQGKINETTAQAQQVQKEINQVRGDKDTSGFLPSDVAKYFFNEAISSSFDTAKLYVSKDDQSKDMKSWINAGVDLNTLSVQEATYSIDNDTANVKVTMSISSSQNEIIRDLSMIKEDGNWKIVDIKGE